VTARPDPVLSAGLAEPSLPRSNGEPVFEEPWQGRALAMAIALVQRTGRDWDDFRKHLIAQIAAAPDRPYWESFAAALADLAREVGALAEH
jgi:Nitrile hydratase beta subunit